MQADSEIRPHTHAWAQVALCVSGVARITAGHSTYLIPASRAVWIPPRMEHALSAVEEAELRTLYIHEDAMASDATTGGLAAQVAWLVPRVLEVTPLLRQLVLQMNVDAGALPEPETVRREWLMGQLALDELRRAEPVRLGIDLPQDKRLRALCEAVLEEPTRHASLADWAADVGASERTVARLFRQELGTTFVQWRQQVLLAKALTLAAHGRPMGLIAAELGYASASAFSAMVRRSVGAPPSRFFGTAGQRA
jgi:AraC-like DNA-binding protein